jgi:hypothetical protein
MRPPEDDSESAYDTSYPMFVVDRLSNHSSVVNPPGDLQGVVSVVDGLAAHRSLGAHLALEGELLDRAVDDVDGVLVSDVGCVRGAVRTMGAHSTGAVGGVSALSTCSASTANRPCTTTSDVTGNLLTIRDLRRSTGALVDEARIRTVVHTLPLEQRASGGIRCSRSRCSIAQKEDCCKSCERLSLHVDG